MGRTQSTHNSSNTTEAVDSNLEDVSLDAATRMKLYLDGSWSHIELNRKLDSRMQ